MFGFSIVVVWFRWMGVSIGCMKILWPDSWWFRRTPTNEFTDKAALWYSLTMPVTYDIQYLTAWMYLTVGQVYEWCFINHNLERSRADTIRSSAQMLCSLSDATLNDSRRTWLRHEPFRCRSRVSRRRKGGKFMVRVKVRAVLHFGNFVSRHILYPIWMCPIKSFQISDVTDNWGRRRNSKFKSRWIFVYPCDVLMDGLRLHHTYLCYFPTE